MAGLSRVRGWCRALLVRRIGRRGAALLFFAFLDAVFSASLFNPPPSARTNPGLKFIAAVAPLWLWAVLWAVAGVLCLISAFRIQDKVGFAAAIGIKILWGGVYVAGGLTGHIERAWVSATIWLCLAAWVAIIASWPEPPLLSDRYAPKRLRSPDPPSWMQG